MMHSPDFNMAATTATLVPCHNSLRFLRSWCCWNLLVWKRIQYILYKKLPSNDIYDSPNMTSANQYFKSIMLAYISWNLMLFYQVCKKKALIECTVFPCTLLMVKSHSHVYNQTMGVKCLSKCIPSSVFCLGCYCLSWDSFYISF